MKAKTKTVFTVYCSSATDGSGRYPQRSFTTQEAADAVIANRDSRFWWVQTDVVTGLEFEKIEEKDALLAKIQTVLSPAEYARLINFAGGRL